MCFHHSWLFRHRFQAAFLDTTVKNAHTISCGTTISSCLYSCVLWKHPKTRFWYGWNVPLNHLPAVCRAQSQSKWEPAESSQCLQQSEANLQTAAELKWGCPPFYLPRLLLLLNWHSTQKDGVISFLIRSDGCQLAADCRPLTFFARDVPLRHLQQKKLHFCSAQHPLSPHRTSAVS